MGIDVIIQGDCLDVMRGMGDECVDMILCDLPYGTTSCAWDTIISFEPLWSAYRRIIKPKGAIVLTASQPFTTKLIASNMEMFKYCWVWNKITAKGHLVVKHRPMQQTEDVIVFGEGRTNYYPIMTDRPLNKIQYTGESRRTAIMGGKKTMLEKHIYDKWYPKTLLTFKVERGQHPTQKPVALFEYLIRTYTNEGEVVLDNCIGSGTTAIACIRSSRRYIGIELEQKYVDIARERIRQEQAQLKLF